jgi:hypothetical protein
MFPLSYTIGYHLELMSWLVGCCYEYWPVMVILLSLWMFMCCQTLSHTHRDSVSTHNTLTKKSYAEKEMGSWGNWRSVFNRMGRQLTKTLSSVWLPILQDERNICTNVLVICNCSRLKTSILSYRTEIQTHLPTCQLVLWSKAMPNRHTGGV